MKFLLKVTNVYRVPDEKAALALREELQNLDCGELIAFGYTQKAIKEHGEVVETYLICKATIEFNKEKESELNVLVNYEVD